MNKDLDIIKQLWTKYQQLLSSQPGSEEILNILISIEQKIHEIVSQSNILKKTPRVESALIGMATKQFNASGYGCNIDDLLDEIIARINKLSLDGDKDILALMDKIWILHRFHKKVIIPTNPNIRLQSWTGNGFEKKENLRYSKFLEMLSFLWDNQIYTDDMKVHSGIVTNNMMRESSYFIIQIPRISRTIAVCDSYWEASFVAQWSLSPDIFFSTIKPDLANKYGVRKVINNKNWKPCLHKLLFYDFEINPQTQQKNKNNIWAKLDISLLSDILDQFHDTPQYHPDSLMKLTQKEQKWILIAGQSLARIATSLNIKEKYGIDGYYHPTGNRYHLACLLREIFWDGYECVNQEIEKGRMGYETKDFWVKEWRKKFEELWYTPDFLMKLPLGKEMGWISIAGQSLYKIAISLNIKEKYGIDVKQFNPAYNKYHLARLLREIFWDGYECVNQEIGRLDYDVKEWKKKFEELWYTPDFLMKLPLGKEMGWISIAGQSLYKIATSLNIKEKYGIDVEQFNPANNRYYLACLLREIFWDGYECVDVYFENDK